MNINQRAEGNNANSIENLAKNIDSAGFEFHLGQVNQIKPKQLKKIDIVHLIRTNNIPELNDVLTNLSQEDFKENDYFEFNKDELKLIQCYQILTQYMIFSINKLSRKNQMLNDLTNQQIKYNQLAEQLLKKQQQKIRNQEDSLEQLTNNCLNMEYLIKQLKLEDRVAQLGVQIGNFDPQQNINNDNNNI